MIWKVGINVNNFVGAVILIIIGLIIIFYPRKLAKIKAESVLKKGIDENEIKESTVILYVIMGIIFFLIGSIVLIKELIN